MAQEPIEKKEETTNNEDENNKNENVKSSSRTSSSSNEQQRSRSRGRSSGRRSTHSSGRSYHSRGRYRRRRVCVFCADKTKTINWKNFEELRRFIADSGAIYPRRKSGLCAKHQRRVAVAIKRARHMALLPYTNEHIRVMSKS